MTDIEQFEGGGSHDKPDNLDSIQRKMRNINDPTPYDGKDKSRKRVGRVPKAVVSFVYNLFKRKSVTCRNYGEPQSAGKRFKACPVPRHRRIIKTRPWWCNYCRLKDDPDPSS